MSFPAYGEELALIPSAADAGTCTLETPVCEVQPEADSEIDAKRFAAASRDRNIYKEVTNNKLYATVFYTYDCPHCHEALTFLTALRDMQSDCPKCREALDYLKNGTQQGPELVIRAYEVKRNSKNMELFRTYARAYNAEIQGVPTIFLGNKFYVGYRMGTSCKMIAEEIATLKGEREGCADTVIDVPFIGEIDVQAVSLFRFSVVLGVLDGFNPCAMWVLMFLLGLLVYSRSRKRILLIGIIFVTASGVVYFAFMAAWFNLFLIIGLSSWLTRLLALIAVTMGLINLKDAFFFKKGISLMIPESAKPTLFKKARAILHEKQTIFAVMGTILLALFVNFIELACTIGLPAIFTKILSERNVSVLDKYLYLVVYNVAYVLPLLVIVIIFAITLGRFKMKESHARILKLLSGLLMLALGLVLLLKPELLILS